MNEQKIERFVMMCADPVDKLVQQSLKEISWEERKKELGIKRDIGNGAWQMASRIIKAQCAGNEDEWDRACQIFHDGNYNEGEVEDALFLQHNALVRILKEAD